MTTQGSVEWHAKLSAAHRGKSLGAEHRAALSAGHLGKLLSAETRAKLSTASRAAWANPEVRAKVTAAVRAAMARPEYAAKHSAAMNRPEVKARRAVALSVALLGNTNVRDAPVKGPCIYCGAPAQTHDHVIPRSRGGSDDPANLVLACVSCNASKGARTPEEWRASAQ